MIENNPGNVSSAFEMLLEARNTMRQEGLLKGDSPHGTWEITEAGRDRLAEGKPA